jgi:integrase/recombinase XerC
VKRGKTPVLDPSEARALLDSTDVTTRRPARPRLNRPHGLFIRTHRRGLAMKVEDV